MAGGYHTCFQDDSTKKIWCWGWNKYGQLGTGSDTPTSHNAPQKVATSFQSPTSLTAGEDMTCVVDKGEAKCWGANYHGQALGYQTNQSGNTIKKVLKPKSPRVPGVGIRQIESQVQHTCALNNQKELYCWGFNWPVTNGALLNSKSKEAVKPTRYNFGSSLTIKKVDTGALHTCGESSQGELWCFGNDFFGAIGNGPPRPLEYVAPTQVSGFARGFRQVESGGMDTNKGPKGASFMHDFSCAINYEGMPKCWGSDANGELGNNNTKSTQSGNSVESAPVDVVGIDNIVRDLSLGGAHACALQSGGTLYCWGDNEYGQLGDGTLFERSIPVKVSMPGNRTPVDVEAGYHHTCVRFQSGEVGCWGRNKEGQIGTGSAKTRQTTPQIVNIP